MFTPAGVDVLAAAVRIQSLRFDVIKWVYDAVPSVAGDELFCEHDSGTTRDFRQETSNRDTISRMFREELFLNGLELEQ